MKSNLMVMRTEQKCLQNKGFFNLKPRPTRGCYHHERPSFSYCRRGIRKNARACASHCLSYFPRRKTRYYSCCYLHQQSGWGNEKQSHATHFKLQDRCSACLHLPRAWRVFVTKRRTSYWHTAFIHHSRRRRRTEHSQTHHQRASA